MDRLFAQMYRHARKAGAQECCGVVARGPLGLQVVPMENVAPDPFNTFQLDEQAYAGLFPYAVAVYHSHPKGGSELSPEDRRSAELTGLPHVVIGMGNRTVSRYVPEKASVQLTGNEYLYGLYDCFSVVEDWMLLSQGVRMPSVERPIAAAELPEAIESNYSRLGWEQVSDTLQPGDVLLLAEAGKEPHHLAIFAGNGKVLHHQALGLSVEEVLSRGLRASVRKVVRHAH